MTLAFASGPHDGAVTDIMLEWTSAKSFFGLGIEHIRFGPDHLLFCSC